MNHWSITILSAGEVALLLFTKLSRVGSLKSLTSKKTSSKTIWKRTGCPKPFKKVDSEIGSKTLGTGVSPETDFGEIPFLYGSQTTVNKWSVLDPLRNLKSWQESMKSPISTDRISTIWLSLQSKERVSLGELKKFLIAGLRVDLCPMHKSIIPLLQHNSNSKKSTLLTLSERESISVEVGSIPWMFSPLELKILTPIKIWSLTVLF